MDQIGDLNHKVERILFLLEADPKIGQEGLINKVNRNDKELADLLVREKVYKTRIIAWGSAIGIIAAAIFSGAKAAFIKLISIL